VKVNEKCDLSLTYRFVLDYEEYIVEMIFVYFSLLPLRIGLFFYTHYILLTFKFCLLIKFNKINVNSKKL
jgi:hypothetical protein